MTNGNGGTLSITEKVGYALGDTASNIYFQTFLLFILYFYTDVVGLSAGSVATMFAVSRVWDAVNDPIMGSIADRTNTRWGKYRPYLLWLPIPFALLGVLTFTTPDLDATGKLVFAYVTYNLLMMAYTAVNVPYAALMGVMTPNSLARTELASYRFVGVFVGSLIVQGATLWLVDAFGGGDARIGWQRTMALLSVFAVAFFFVTFATTKERVFAPPGQKGNLGRDLKDLLASRPWVLVALATFFQLSFIVARSSSVAYYFKYFVQDQQLNLFGNVIKLSFERFSSSFLISGTLVTILGAILTKPIARRLGKSRAYVGFLALSAVTQALFYVVRPQDVMLIYLLNFIVSFAWGPVSVLQWAMYTDVADDMEWTNGRRVTGLVMAGSLFALQMGLAFGGAFVGWMLESHGFVANQAQSEDALNGIRLLMSLYPAVLGLAGAAVMLFYPLTDDLMVRIEQDLTSRREGGER
jgi:GPH family glycoside/pentoside/hexuronide:cation symporter